jgi:hypothetical protein
MTDSTSGARTSERATCPQCWYFALQIYADGLLMKSFCPICGRMGSRDPITGNMEYENGYGVITMITDGGFRQVRFSEPVAIDEALELINVQYDDAAILHASVVLSTGEIVSLPTIIGKEESIEEKAITNQELFDIGKSLIR